MHSFRFVLCSLPFLATALAAPAESYPSGQIHVKPDGEDEQGCIGDDLTWRTDGSCGTFKVTSWFNNDHKRFQLSPHSGWGCSAEAAWGNVTCKDKNPLGAVGWSTYENTQSLQKGARIGPFEPFQILHDADYWTYSKPGSCQSSQVFVTQPQWAPTLKIALYWYPVESSKKNKKATRAFPGTPCAVSQIEPHMTANAIPSPAAARTSGQLAVFQNGKRHGCITADGSWSLTNCAKWYSGRYNSGRYTLEPNGAGPCSFDNTGVFSCSTNNDDGFFIDGSTICNPIVKPEYTQFSHTFYAKSAPASGQKVQVYDTPQDVEFTIQYYKS